MVKIWCGCVQFCLWRNRGMCWPGMMHLGTLEVSWKGFDEGLCWGFSRVCEDCQRIGLQDWIKMRIWLWKWGIWPSCTELEISCGQRETSSDANIAQVDCAHAWLGEFRLRLRPRHTRQKPGPREWGQAHEAEGLGSHQKFQIQRCLFWTTHCSIDRSYHLIVVEDKMF